MASLYSSLKIELIGTGEQAGTWGITTNTNLGTALEEAITGRATATFPSDDNYTLPYTDNNGAQIFRNLVLNVTSSGNLGATRDLIIPSIKKQYIVENNTSGGQSIVVKTVSGNGITIQNGRVANLFCDGTNTRFASDLFDINGGSIDGTPIGTHSASTGAFTTATITTATVTTGNITTGNITTGNITTGNINTLNVGTQTNKATISYTTNAARTLTIPAVSGNRTFAFLEEAQTFTATQSFNTILVGTQTNKATISYTTNAARTLTVPAVSGNRTFSFLEEAQTFTANQTVAANLIFSGNGRRIIGDFSSISPNFSNRTMIQTSVTNGQTVINTIPNGTSNQSGFSALNSSDAPNASSIQILALSDESRLASSIGSESATYNPLTFHTNGSEKMRINVNGNVGVGLIAGISKFEVKGSTADDSALAVNFKNSADAELFFVRNDGLIKTGLETLSPYNHTTGLAANLVVNSDGVLYRSTSSLKYKKDVVNYDKGLSAVMSLRPVYYKDIRTDKDKIFGDQTYAGLIAEEVHSIGLQEFVQYDSKNEPNALSYGNMVALLTKAIQELKTELDGLKSELRMMKGN